jgi:hypothetical protein
MIEVLQEPSATVIQPPRGGSTIFVSSSLAIWATNEPNGIARDFQINDTVYRRLDPEYYGWLRSRMVLARKAATAGHLDAAAFEDLRLRFNAVHEWAVRHFGEEQLLQAVRSLRAAEYKPPIAEDDRPILPPPVLRKSGSDHIDPQRGLVCYLKAGDRIGEVTLHSIEIIHPLPSEVRLRFYNPDVAQPWERRNSNTSL